MNQREINSLKATGKPYKKGLGNGLTLRVSAAGEKTYMLQYKWRGRLKQVTFGSVTLSDAQLLAAQARTQIAQGMDPSTQKQRQKEREQSIGEFINRDYTAHIRARQRNPNDTLAVLKAEFGSWYGKPLSFLTQNKAEDWRNRRREQGLSVASVNKYTNHLKALTRQAQVRGLIDSDPLQNFQRLQDKRKPNIRWLSQREEEALLQALADRDRGLWLPEQREWEQLSDELDTIIFAGTEPLGGDDLKELVGPHLHLMRPLIGDYLLPVVKLALALGLRRQEVLRLRWSDIQQVDNQTFNLIVSPDNDKSGKGRVLPMNMEDVVLLQVWRSWSQWKKRDSEWVFPNPKTGQPMRDIDSSWENLVKHAARHEPSLKGISFRVLRSTFGSRLVQKGVHMLQVSNLLGHSSVAITERHYAGLENKAAREAMRSLSPLTTIDSVAPRSSRSLQNKATSETIGGNVISINSKRV